MSKQIEVGKNYSGLFGLGEGDRLVYIGDNKFECYSAKKNETAVKESAAMVARVEAAINQPTVMMGTPK